MHPNEELARRELAVIEDDDPQALASLYADDFVLHYPVRNPLSGVHEGLDAFLERIGALLGTDGTIRREAHDVLGSDEHAVQLLRVTATVGSRSHTWLAAVVLHVRDGRFSEAWISVDDQHALDEFLNSLSPD
jgi:ketosteroid isomerase-like protein